MIIRLFSVGLRQRVCISGADAVAGADELALGGSGNSNKRRNSTPDLVSRRERRMLEGRTFDGCGPRTLKKDPRSSAYHHGICPEPSIGLSNELITPDSGSAPYGFAP